MSTHFIGADWSSGLWVAIPYSDATESPDIGLYDTIRDIWTDYNASAHRIVVDVPIGLWSDAPSYSWRKQTDSHALVCRP